MDRTRRCASCSRDLPLSQFAFRNRDKGSYQSYCRECSNRAWRKWYSVPANKEKHLATLRRRRKRRIERNRSIVRELKSQPCADCGGVFAAEAMDFDHLEEKDELISKLVYTAGTDRLLAEIAKCEVVCANCHRIRTAQRLIASDIPD